MLLKIGFRYLIPGGSCHPSPFLFFHTVVQSSHGVSRGGLLWLTPAGRYKYIYKKPRAAIVSLYCSSFSQATLSLMLMSTLMQAEGFCHHHTIRKAKHPNDSAHSSQQQRSQLRWQMKAVTVVGVQKNKGNKNRAILPNLNIWVKLLVLQWNKVLINRFLHFPRREMPIETKNMDK